MSLETISTVIRVGAFAALVATTTGCDLDGLLDVTDPSRLLADNVETPEQVDAIMNGVEADFVCAFGAYVLVTADLSDEFEDTNAGGDNWSLDRRRPQAQNAWGDNDCTAALPSAYVPASRARWVADNAIRLLESWTDEEVTNRQDRLARAYLLAGFSLYMLGAAHCSVALDEGPELTPAEVFVEAEARFSSAMSIAQTQGLTDIENAALVGRARVRLFTGNTAGALTDANAVPAGFVMNVFPSDATVRMRNRIWNANLLNFSFGVAPESRGLTTGGTVDPRTATFDTGQNTGWAPGNVWGQDKYQTASDPMPIARYEEAQLIVAEIELGATAVGIINALRAPHSLPTFSSNDDAEIMDEVVAERRRELWLEGHRAYDIDRLGLPLDPVPGADYQLGVKGGTYGDQTCIPLPIIETFNNRTIRGT